jgi:glycosidase
MKNVFIKIGVVALLSVNQYFAQGDQVKSVLSAPIWTKNATIYEVNIRQFTPEGTFKAFETHLPRLQKMGVDILWLMPINPIGELNRKGGLGSYYAVKDYKAVNPNFGTEDDFQSLINAAHTLGIKVIIDWPITLRQTTAGFKKVIWIGIH